MAQSKYASSFGSSDMVLMTRNPGFVEGQKNIRTSSFGDLLYTLIQRHLM